MKRHTTILRRIRRKLLTVALGAALSVVVLGGVIRPYRVSGDSDAPNYLAGDLVLVNQAAYGLPVPYTHTLLLRWREPTYGDYVLFRAPGNDQVVFKAVAARPRDQIEVHEGRVLLNGEPLSYVPLAAETANAAHVSGLEEGYGARLLLVHEQGPGFEQPVLLEPEARDASYGPVQVPADHVFVLGSNRHRSRDSRHFGMVPMRNVTGKLMMNLSARSRQEGEATGPPAQQPQDESGGRGRVGKRRVSPP